MQALYIGLCRDAKSLRNREVGRNEASKPNGLASHKIEIGALRQGKGDGTGHTRT
jgi:hypothetical protein